MSDDSTNKRTIDDVAASPTSTGLSTLTPEKEPGTVNSITTNDESPDHPLATPRKDDETTPVNPDDNSERQVFVPRASAPKKPAPVIDVNEEIDSDAEYEDSLNPMRPDGMYWRVIHIKPKNASETSFCGAACTIEGYLEYTMAQPFFNRSSADKKYIAEIDCIPYIFKAKHLRHPEDPEKTWNNRSKYVHKCIVVPFNHLTTKEDIKEHLEVCITPNIMKLGKCRPTTIAWSEVDYHTRETWSEVFHPKELNDIISKGRCVREGLKKLSLTQYYTISPSNIYDIYKEGTLSLKFMKHHGLKTKHVRGADAVLLQQELAKSPFNPNPKVSSLKKAKAIVEPSPVVTVKVEPGIHQNSNKRAKLDDTVSKRLDFSGTAVSESGDGSSTTNVVPVSQTDNSIDMTQDDETTEDMEENK